MKTPTQTPLHEVVCKNVKALLAERKTSVRELAISINRDHSQLNKVLNNQAILHANLIDDFAAFFNIDRETLMSEKRIDYQTDDMHNTIHIIIRMPS